MPRTASAAATKRRWRLWDWYDGSEVLIAVLLVSWLVVFVGNVAGVVHSSNGAFSSRSTVEIEGLYPATKRSPKSRRKFSYVVCGRPRAMPLRHSFNWRFI